MVVCICFNKKKTYTHTHFIEGIATLQPKSYLVLWQQSKQQLQQQKVENCKNFCTF